MNTLITGGTGFIGRALIDKLLKDEHRVTILTRDERKVDSPLNKKVEVLEADIGHLASLEKLDPRLKGIDVIFHLAASLDYFGDRKKLFRVNVEGTVNLLNWAERNGIKRFIYISSIEAMGLIKKDEIPADETYSCNPISPYGGSKLEAEKQVKSLSKEKNLSSVILRLGNVYGPGSPAFILPIARAIIERGDLLKYLPVYGDRYVHPVYIEDVIEGIMKASQPNIDELYILAGNNYVTIHELFGLVSEILGVTIKDVQKSNFDRAYINLRKAVHRFQKKADLITYFMAGKGREVHRAYSIEKAKKEIGYLPKVNLKEGISKTLEWARSEGLIDR